MCSIVSNERCSSITVSSGTSVWQPQTENLSLSDIYINTSLVLEEYSNINFAQAFLSFDDLFTVSNLFHQASSVGTATFY